MKRVLNYLLILAMLLFLVSCMSMNGLIKEKTDANGFTPLHRAICDGDMSLAVFCVKNGNDINAKTKDGVTPLILASFQGYIKIVEYLIENGAEINTSDNIGRTPLYAAVWNNHTDVAKYLIQKGANVNVQVGERYALHHAAFHNNVEIVRLLIEHGADVNVKDKSNLTPMETAVMYKSIEVVYYFYQLQKTNNTFTNI